MVISGNTLPVVVNSQANQNRTDPQRSVSQRAQSSGQQTAEYVYRIDIEGDGNPSRSRYDSYSQRIDPANTRAIQSYSDIEKNSPYKSASQGRLLDIFI